MRDATGVRHGVVWPFGTVAVDGGVRVPGLAEVLRPGVPFWVGGGVGSAPALGVCDAEPDLYLGGGFSLTNPVPSGP
ncbi:MAG TPA: hypothetical protein VKR30_06940 [Candidatus Limnocylindrales bacterium]|nr:hypothetical protein [Candidatus Limnocylindrales bacterium]